MYIIPCLEEIERQQILNTYHTKKQIYFIKQYDKGRLIVNNRNLSLNEKKKKIYSIHSKMMKYFSIVNDKFFKKYGIKNIF